MADSATSAPPVQGHDLTMDHQLFEEGKMSSSCQESVKIIETNTTEIINGLNGYDQEVVDNSGNFTEDLLNLDSKPHQPDIISLGQTETKNYEIDSTLSDPVQAHTLSETEVVGGDKPNTEGVLIDFDFAAGGADIDQKPASEIPANPFLVDNIQVENDEPDDDSEADLVDIHHLKNDDIMQRSFIGDESELSSLNPFDVDKDVVEESEAVHADSSNPFAPEQALESSVDPVAIEESHDKMEPQSNVNTFVGAEETEEIVQNGSSVDAEVAPIEKSNMEEKSETDDAVISSNGDSVVEVGPSVDQLQIVDNVPIDSIEPNKEPEVEPKSIETEPEILAKEQQVEEKGMASEKQESEKKKPASASTGGAKKSPRDAKSKMPTSARSERKIPALQKASSVPVRSEMAPRPPLTRSTQLAAKTTKKSTTETRQVQSARSSTAELKRSASSATTPTRVRSTPPRRIPTASKGASSDSGVEEDKSAKRNGDLKKRGSTGSAETGTPSPRPGGKGPVKSRVGSLDNATHTPRGGNVKITSQKTEYKAASRIGSKDNMTHKPGGGSVKIENKRSSYDGTKSRIGSLDNAKHAPGGGDKKIHSGKLEWKVESRVGSLDNAKHTAGGGEKKIESQKLEWKAGSRIGSLDNATYSPGGGKVKIESKKLDFKDKAASKIGSKDNIKHKPGGGEKKIETQKVDFKAKAQSKVGSTDYIDHKAGGGDKKIYAEKVNWKAESKVGSMDNSQHAPGGGDKKIETQKLTYRDDAQARTDNGKSD